MFRTPLLTVLLLTTPVLAADRLPVDRLRAAVDADAPRAEALLQRLVEQNSGTLNRDGVRAVADQVRAELTPLGFTVRWVDMAAAGRSGHLIATHAGRRGGGRVLLIGHLDTVFEPTSPFQHFARTTETRATGPGVVDDKGGIVVIVGALRAMQAAGTLRAANIELVLTGDEERPGQPTAVARADLIAAGRRADAALEFEPLAREGGRDYATVARRSGSAWELGITARTGHSAGVFGGIGDGAIYELARILDRFRRELVEPHATFNVGLVAGGTPAAIGPTGATASAEGKTNVIAERAVARGDLRTLTPEQDARLRSRMAVIVADHLPGTLTASFDFYDTTPPVAPTERNAALLGELNAVNRDLGLDEMPPFDPDQRGAADSGFVAADVAVLGGMGLAGGGTHGEGEWADLGSIGRQTLRAAALISRITTRHR
ncbi:M20/M25/M40 family metallo-hydrolase [Sphingomonas sp.]|uniref:M20/M25/M40 family metallo-hydrolase n=1 Tax=Sphingomonas sp. TaxID=28214 RepID=UPI003CC5EFE5